MRFWSGKLLSALVAVRSRHCSDELQDDEGLDEFSERREMAEKNRVCEKELHTSSLSKVLVLRVRWIRTIGKSATRAQSETCKEHMKHQLEGEVQGHVQQSWKSMA